MAFIIPTNFLNCLYYQKLRKYINDNMCILNIINLPESNFIDTEQSTICIIIQNKKCEKNKFMLTINNYIIFNSNIDKIQKLLLNSTNLNNLGFNVSVGTIVWNQHKEILTDDKKKHY